jgi:outer membrane receptor for ferrienterochelin and colicin
MERSFPKWVKFALSVGILFFVSPTILLAQKPDPYQLTLEQLGHIQVFTASRSLTLAEKAPSIVTVVTAEEIRQRGYVSLQDVMERVVGFVAFSDNFDMILGQRGFVEDGNHAYLFMVDGHSINNQIDYSIGHDQIIPSLSKVKRIEILHTPGSTLWGADAAGGIINIITYDGKDIDYVGNKLGAFRVNADYEAENHRHFQDLVYGKKISENSDLMLSFNRSQSDGGLLPAYHAGDNGFVEWSQGRPWDPRANAENLFGPAYALYGKYRIGGFTLLANHTNSLYVSNFNTPIDGSANSGHYRYVSYGEARYSSHIGGSLGIEAGVFYDDFLDKTEGGFTKDFEPPVGYTGYGGSSILSHVLGANRMQVGVQYDRRAFDSMTFYTTPLKARVENVYGVFSEDEYAGLKNTILTLGVRYDYNDLRAAGGKLYPRAAVVYGFSERWSAKYTYNSGYVRPLYGQIRGFGDIYQAVKDGAPWIGPHKSQRSESNELKLK